MPYASIASADSDLKADTADKLAQCCTIHFDSTRGRVIFSFPYYDKYSVFRGSLVFYTDSADFTRFLVSRNSITLSDKGTLVAPADVSLDSETTATAVNSGIVFGLPAVGESILEKAIVEKWNSGLYGTEHLVATASGDWILLTSIKSSYGKIGWVYNETVFTFPQSVKILLLVCIYITLFLIVFMLFNLKHDDMVIIRDRIRRFQLALVTEYVDRKDTADWKKITDDIALRKQDVSDEIRKSLGRAGKRHSKEVDALLEKSWNEIISTLSGKQITAIEPTTSNDQNTAQIKAMLEDILSKGTLTVSSIPALKTPAKSTELVEEAEPVEEVESAEEAELVEEAEPVEKLEPVEEAEPVEELEPVEEAEPVEELEPVEEAEPVEELEPLEEAESVEEAEPVEELEPLEEAESVEEAEPVEELEPIEEIDSSEVAKALDNRNYVSECNPVVEEKAAPKKIENEFEEIDHIFVDELPFEETMQLGEPHKEFPKEDACLCESIQFSVCAPDFSFLDSKQVNAEDEKNIAKNADEPKDAVPAPVQKIPESVKMESVPLAQFNAEQVVGKYEKSSIQEKEFAEPLEFGDKQMKLPLDNDEFATTFKTGSPDFSSLNEVENSTPIDKKVASVVKERVPVAEKKQEHRHGLFARAQREEEKMLTAVPEVETLAPAESTTFTFTHFGRECVAPIELSPAKDAIVLKNGVFMISGEVETNGIKQDPSFRKLVESVLK